MSKKTESLHDPHPLGMDSMHAVLGTEPANGFMGLAPLARRYSQELAELGEAIEAEQAALFAGQPPTYLLHNALQRTTEALGLYREHWVSEQRPEETS